MTIPVTQQPVQQDADTYGWDTAFAIDFTNANAAIAANWANVSPNAKNLSQAASDDPTFHIDATLGPWQLTVGGDGKNIRMNCPVTAGSYTAGSKTFPLDSQNMQVIIEVGMEWVPDPSQFAFVISGNTEIDPIKTSLDQNTIPAQLSTEFQNHGKTLSSAATALVQKQSLEWLITDGSTYYYIFASQDKDANEFLNVYQYEKAWRQNLQVLKDAVSADQPAVAIITIVNNPATGIAAAVLPDLLSVWFNTNIGEFNHVFAVLDLSPQLSQTASYAWTKPTATTYAVTDQGTLDSSIFGVLTMTSNDAASDNHQVSPFAIPSGSDANGADAGFLISGTKFIQQMMLPGAQAIFNNAPASAFEIINDGLTIQNTNDMIWGKFMLDNNKKGTLQGTSYTADLDAGNISANLSAALENLGIYIPSGYSSQVTTKGSQWLLTNGQPNVTEYILTVDSGNIDVYLSTAITIAAGQFKLTLMHSYVQIEFIDLKYSYDSDFDVHCNYTEQVELTLQNQGGKNIFWYDQVMKNLVISVTKTQSAITREIVEGAVTAVLALVAVAGPIIEGLSASAEIGEVTAEGGEAVVDAEAFEEAEASNPEAAEQNEANAAQQAADQSGGKLTNIKNAFSTPKWKFVGALAAVAGAISGIDNTVDAIIENAANKQWNNVPGFDDFANQLIAPYTFPSVNSFTVASAWLAGSLQVGLKTNTASSTSSTVVRS